MLLTSLLASHSFVAFAYDDEYPSQSVRDEITQWVTATAAILNHQNHGHHRLFDLPESDRQRYVGCSRTKLAQSWNIRNAEDLRRQVASLTERGHNAVFLESYMIFSESRDELGEELLFLVLDYLYGNDAVEYVARVLYFGDKWGDRGIIAWDLFRVGTIVCMAYAAGFIEREEAYLLMEPAINLLRVNFSSWEEAVDNYLDGFVYWGNGRNEAIANRRLERFHEIAAAYEDLFDDALFARPHTINLERVSYPVAEY